MKEKKPNDFKPNSMAKYWRRNYSRPISKMQTHIKRGRERERSNGFQCVFVHKTCNNLVFIRFGSCSLFIYYCYYFSKYSSSYYYYSFAGALRGLICVPYAHLALIFYTGNEFVCLATTNSFLLSVVHSAFEIETKLRQ